MRLRQASLVLVTTPVGGWYISSKNKITKGGLRQAQARSLLLSAGLPVLRSHAEEKCELRSR